VALNIGMSGYELDPVASTVALWDSQDGMSES
jgi:hypothetical protein